MIMQDLVNNTHVRGSATAELPAAEAARAFNSSAGGGGGGVGGGGCSGHFGKIAIVSHL
jgi:hypothetical protein